MVELFDNNSPNVYVFANIITNLSVDLKNVEHIKFDFPNGHTITLTADDVYKILKGLTEKMDEVEE